MYTKYFKLKEEPFATTSDPRFLYRSAGHQEALERLISAVSLRRGIAAIIAEPGLGKSTLIRTLLSGLQPTVHFAWVFNTTMTAHDLLRFICRDFGFIPQSHEKGDLLIELYTFFINEFENQRIPLLIIDEAQNLRPEVLEEIRLLSNLETINHKLVQIILSGQPQLQAQLELPGLVQLKQRIAFRASLSRLKNDDTTAYIRHRLNVAGGRNDELFSEGALHNIHDISGGIPRLINQICEQALMTAEKRRQQTIDAMIIQELLESGTIQRAPVLPEPIKSMAEMNTKRKSASAKQHEAIPVNDRAEQDDREKGRPVRIIREKADIFEAIDFTELVSVI